MNRTVEKQKHQVYLVDGKEVILDDLRKVEEGTVYTVREVGLNSKQEYEFGPKFHTARIQPIGRVIAA